MSISDKLTTIAENVPKVYEAGKKSEYDRFWDTYQANGKRVSYQYAFCLFDDETFKPKYDMKLGAGYTGTYMFYGCNVTNLAEALEKQGIVLDTSMCGYMMSMFYNCKTTRLPVIDCTHAADYSASNGMQYAFRSCSAETIDKLILTEKQQYSDTFRDCTNLKNIVFEGVIGNNIGFEQSPLSKDSITSIVNHLSESSSGKTLTLKKNAVTSAFLQEINFLAEAVNPSFVVLTCYAEGYKLDMGDGTYDYWGVDIEFDGNNYHLNEGYNEVLLSVSKDYFSSSGDIRDDITVADNSLDGKISNVKVYTTAYLEWQDLVNSKPNWTISLV